MTTADHAVETAYVRRADQQNVVGGPQAASVSMAFVVALAVIAGLALRRQDIR